MHFFKLNLLRRFQQCCEPGSLRNQMNFMDPEDHYILKEDLLFVLNSSNVCSTFNRDLTKSFWSRQDPDPSQKNQGEGTELFQFYSATLIYCQIFLDLSRSGLVQKNPIMYKCSFMLFYQECDCQDRKSATCFNVQNYISNKI